MTSSDDRNLYRELGLTSSATDAEIRAAYVQLARVLHPDRYQAASEAEQRLAERRMREVNGAWQILGKPDKRTIYDAELKYQMMSRNRPQPVRPHFDDDGNPVRRAAGANVGRPGEFVHPPEVDDDDAMVVSASHAFLLRRLPVILAIALAVAIFVGTAYATTKSDTPPSTTLACNSALRPGCPGH